MCLYVYVYVYVYVDIYRGQRRLGRRAQRGAAHIPRRAPAPSRPPPPPGFATFWFGVWIYRGRAMGVKAVCKQSGH